MALEAQDKLAFVDGSIPLPQDPSKFCKWKPVDSMVKGWLTNSISNEIGRAILVKIDAKGRNSKRRDSNKKDKHCDHCNAYGHTKDTYFKLHRYPQWYKELREKKGVGKKLATTVKEMAKFIKAEKADELVNFAKVFEASKEDGHHNPSKPAESQSTVAPPFCPQSCRRSVHCRIVEKSPSKKHKDPSTKGGETGDRFDFRFVRRLLHMWLQVFGFRYGAIRDC
ncbi:putative reverse transcriptase [Senna tora]|uniref:Putative reverse transcriptase n=1 Tax=Senna tora TaxID=362788 RepID=A0A834XE81_9FABA|nr:putative reverse transcriptase [Senna tora]